MADKKKYVKKDRKKEMEEITHMLEEGVRNIFSSEKYLEWLKVCSRFHSYSLGNQILIMLQTGGTATQVAGYKTWQSLGRQVRKGERGITILVPLFSRVKTEKKEDPGEPEAGAEGDGTEKELIIRRFGTSRVFDIAQTEGKDLPSITEELTDDDEAYDGIIEKLVRFSPVPVVFTSDLPEGVYGCFNRATQDIKVRGSLSRQHRLKTLVHEIAHSILDNADSGDDRETMEVRAESVAYCVCAGLDIPTDQYSFGYIAGWSSGRDVKELKAVMKDIRDTADRILTAITDAPGEAAGFAG